VFAVALPVAGDRVTFTNSPWTFSIREVREALGLKRLAVINDFMAQALAVPALAPEERVELCPGEVVPGEPIGVIGPGTGLGVALLVPDRGAWRAIASEGGHVSFAPFDERDVEVWRLLRRRFGHVSDERVLAAPGLVNLAQALAELAGEKLEIADPMEISQRAAAGSCRFCVEALQRFSLLLGFAAGDLALTLCARGGIYIGGGLSKRLGPLLDAARLRQGFMAKGRFEVYLARIPVYLTVRKDPGLLGAAVYQLP
jgi:glucokinase